MSPIIEVLLWLSIPVISTIAAWVYFLRKSKADVNADLGIVETDLQQLRRKFNSDRKD
ncbi:MAG: hypothetical protein RL038_460 [Actinomycetota bacterium]